VIVTQTNFTNSTPLVDGSVSCCVCVFAFVTTGESSTNPAPCGGGRRHDDEIVGVRTGIHIVTTLLSLSSTLKPFTLMVTVVVVVAVVGQGVGRRVLLLAITVAGPLLPVKLHLILWLHVQVELLWQQQQWPPPVFVFLLPLLPIDPSAS